MLNVVIVTSSETGSAAHHLPILIRKAQHYRISTVLLNTAGNKKNRRWAKRKIQKVLDIGPLGALLGWYMRNWYTKSIDLLLQLPSVTDTCAEKDNISIHRIDGLNSDAMKKALASSGADVAISLGNGFIAPRIFRVPKFGMINIHHEELPAFKNAQSVIWQLHEGYKKTGYTVHEITREIDGGKILKKASLPIQFKDRLSDTVSHSYAATWDAAAEGLSEVLNAFDDHQSKATKQESGGHFTTPTFKQFLRIHSQWKRLKTDVE